MGKKNENKDVQKTAEETEVQEVQIGALCVPGSRLASAFAKLADLSVNLKFDRGVYKLQDTIANGGGNEFAALWEKMIKAKGNVKDRQFTKQGFEARAELIDTVGQQKIEVDTLELDFGQKGDLTPNDLRILEAAGIIKVKD